MLGMKSFNDRRHKLNLITLHHLKCKYHDPKPNLHSPKPSLREFAEVDLPQLEGITYLLRVLLFNAIDQYRQVCRRDDQETTKSRTMDHRMMEERQTFGGHGTIRDGRGDEGEGEGEGVFIRWTQTLFKLREMLPCLI